MSVDSWAAAREGTRADHLVVWSESLLVVHLVERMVGVWAALLVACSAGVKVVQSVSLLVGLTVDSKAAVKVVPSDVPPVALMVGLLALLLVERSVGSKA